MKSDKTKAEYNLLLQRNLQL